MAGAGLPIVRWRVLCSEQVDELVCKVATMDRADLLHQFRTYPARFPVDFTEDFLGSAPLERLRHIFLALCLQTQRMPSAA